MLKYVLRKFNLPGKKIAVAILAAYLAFGLAVSSLYGEPVLRIKNTDAKSEFPIVKIQISISNIEKLDISEISEDDLTVYEDGYKINAIKLSQLKETEDYFYLVFSLDSSRSISKKYLATIKSIASDVIRSAHERDKIAIYRFNDEVERLSNFGAKRSELISALEKVESRGRKTMLYNSIYDCIDLLSEVKRGKRAVIVFTDGKDEGSSITENDIIKFARSEGVPVYFICPDKLETSYGLARISKLTSGKTILVKEDSRPKGIYKRITFPGKNKFLLQYRTSLAADGASHKLEVRLRYGDIREREQAATVFDRSGIFLVNWGDRNTILLVLIVVLLTGIMALLIFFMLKFRREPVSVGVPVKVIPPEKIPEPLPSYYNENEEDQSNASAKVLSAQNPEYSYTDAWLIEKNGPQTGKKFPLFWEETTIGRGKDNSIIIEDEGVSPRHSKIKRIKTAYQLLDLASDNGTFLNGKKLLRPKTLFDWDEIKIGRTILIFRGLKKPQ